eukprot:GFUD01079805.1.p1 GENE.GFUD01079805.1~~GFUD01079805.1.p1  ORF type:complete len:280 (-),score=74.63 GFUD01079805.1:160-999(-)
MSRRERDDDYDASQRKGKAGSQTPSQAATQHGFSRDDMDKMISDATFYFLVADQKKSLIKRADLTKYCDLNKKPRAVQEDVVNRAIQHLLKTFGIKVQESESKKGCYFLINQLQENQDDENLQHINWSEKENAQMGLTFTILGLIFMSNGKVSDDTLFKFLKLLGVFEEERAKKTGRGADQAGDPVDPEVSELFDGDTKKFVNDILVGRQHYLKRDRVQGPDPEVEAYEYSWGERAEFEVKKSDVLKMVCELYECEPRMFKEQYDKVKEAEGDDALDTE